MKNNPIILFLYISMLVLISSCKKKTDRLDSSETVYTPLKYDTTAVDSFSAGAVSVDIADKIKRSSVQYQDSVKQAILEQEELRKEIEEKEKIKEEESKKEEETKKAEKKPIETNQKTDEITEKPQSAPENIKSME